MGFFGISDAFFGIFREFNDPFKICLTVCRKALHTRQSLHLKELNVHSWL